jgi:hypothetical protein
MWLKRVTTAEKTTNSWSATHELSAARLPDRRTTRTLWWQYFVSPPPTVKAAVPFREVYARPRSLQFVSAKKMWLLPFTVTWWVGTCATNLLQQLTDGEYRLSVVSALALQEMEVSPLSSVSTHPHRFVKTLHKFTKHGKEIYLKFVEKF